MDKEEYFVWSGWFRKRVHKLVYERKYNAEEQCYQDVLRIEEPKAKVTQ